MFKSIDAFRAKLDAGRICIGLGITFSDPAVTECMAASSDFFWIDLEHTPINLESLQAHLMAARAVDVPGLVRVPSLDIGMIKRVLDMGAPGLIVPQVRSAAEVRQVVSACRYQPLGDRGFGPRRASRYGGYAADKYVKMANRSLFVSVQIENTDAYRDLDSILKVPGLDSIVVGPYDLSASMGKIGRVNDPDVIGALENIATKARKAGLHVGIGMGIEEDFAVKAVGMGINWVQIGCDFHYLGHYTNQVLNGVRTRLGSKPADA